MYRANKSGRFRSRSGTLYKFFNGQTIDAPKGDLFGCPGVEWIGAEPEKKPEFKTGTETIIPDKMKSTDFTIAELKKMDLSDKDVSFFEDDRRKTVQKFK